VLSAPERPDYLVLEASAVADPMSIYATFTDSRHRDPIRLDSVTCVVDADQIFEYIDRAPEVLALIVRQIGRADLVLLDKVDLTGPDRVAWLRAWIDEIMNRRPTRRNSRGHRDRGVAVLAEIIVHGRGPEAGGHHPSPQLVGSEGVQRQVVGS
jgi:G3E family GTPase